MCLFLFVQDLKYWSIKNKKINVKISLSTFRTSTTQRHKVKTKVRPSFDFGTSYDRNNKSRSFYNSSTEKMNDGTRRMSELENSNCDKNENGKCDNILVESSDKIITAKEWVLCYFNWRSTKKSLIIITRKGWCPRTGGGQRLMIKIAVNEDIVLATCQDKYSE